MKHILSTAFVLSIFWLANSGHYSVLLLALGAISVALVVFIAHQMDVVDHESQPFQLYGINLAKYFLWLIGKIVSSNFQVVKLVWQGKPAISPCVGWVALSQKTEVGKVIYANSITLTPGTVAMNLDDDRVFIHALTRQSLAEVVSGEMDRRVTAVER
ncbi:MAG TPA: cation transporter [Spongiibacteraceae bacterium]|mgnify:CR=1 FL=1|nr:cation transporter [Spongiibacteraceae bacterium]HCS27100.1 cation transporter [Spongiibacteraceae bacterium]|tara:strand:- start:925 stop:1398 length:474 start_codon:yes stop_codon:yes gene_type:complete